ncbi:hypothetical protein BN8_06539 [Fibrisoma limi BUZ 3]|uniref:Uncharacterized protein n=1 Tax=Fibrisoma limi BUZ 3 TaxID=1185876 RepID=I2GTA6_9BACT|nr:hypothetical protein BN8_06539 [Fibrisoma limi BUZ 3]
MNLHIGIKKIYSLYQLLLLKNWGLTYFYKIFIAKYNI